MNKKNNKTPRRLLTATMSFALLISLSSCSGATNTTGKLDANEIYAQVGDYSVTNGDIWNELKWDASTVLENQITNVVLNEQINKITLVMKKSFNTLSDSDKETLDISSSEDFSKLYEKYSTRLIDYVVQDIYNLNFSNKDYWDSLDALDKTTKKISEKEYTDGLISTYQKDKTADGKSFAELIENASKDNTQNYIIIANELSEIYYPLYAKELLAYDKLNEDIITAQEEDDDDDDEKIGYFSNTDYTGKFKSEYINTYDLNMVLIRFTSENEYNDTLRAFGLKMYNKKLYFIKDNANEGYEDYLNSDDRMSYESYISYYDDFKNTSLNKENGVEELSGAIILEIYIQIYNYLYGGYRTPLATAYEYPFNDINDLRANIYRIISDYSVNPQAKYDNAINLLKTNNASETTISSDELASISDSFKLYAYETLKLTDDNGIIDMNSRYSTSTQSQNNGYYICYKFDEALDDIEDEKIKAYEAFYNPNLSTYEIIDFILDAELNPGLQDEIIELMTTDKISDSVISSYLSDEEKEIKIKIYNEAVEISYSTSHEDYSKTLKKAKNKNILATIEYNKKVWNLNIKADSEDKNSICYPGTEEKIGVYDILERQYGATTAIDLISNKIIKDTDQYSEVKADKEIVTYYEDYLEMVLVNFANNGYSSNGYSSTIGKYNFLMLYYHTANVDEIINDYYLIQHASSKLLTDYSNSSLSDFFKYYTDLAYKDYFSLEGTRLVVYMDIDDDNEADEIDLNDLNSWIYKEVEFEGQNVTMEYVAKSLVYDVYNKLSASSTSHTDKLSSLVDEINNSARVIYANNPIVAENQWAKYRKLGLKVTTEEFSTTNADLSINFNLKQRLYDYARGYSTDANGNKTTTYQYYINGTVPTVYIEPLTEDAISTENDSIIATNDGFNLILVTAGKSKPSAEWKEEDDPDGLLKNIVIKYNDEYITINNIYNEGNDNPDLDGSLNSNQIMLYILDYAVNGSSTLSPSSISSAITTFLEPVVSRYTSSETQRIILLNFIKNATGIDSNTDLYDVVKFTNETYNGENGYFNTIIRINQDVADNYDYLYNDTTGTSNSYPDWWERLQEEVEGFLNKTNSKEAE
ncbi:MAG: hypothetical protein ACI35S_08500 [Anaeroplasma sp.]